MGSEFLTPDISEENVRYSGCEGMGFGGFSTSGSLYLFGEKEAALIESSVINQIKKLSMFFVCKSTELQF